MATEQSQDDADTDWSAVQSIISSDHRAQVASILHESGPLTPSTISEHSSLEVTHVSRSLGQLREQDLVELLVPESTKKGRIYGLTDDGRSAVNAAGEVDS